MSHLFGRDDVVSLGTMMRSIRRTWRSWAACLVLLCLILGWGAEALGDCDREEFGDAGAGIVCLHGEGSRTCGDDTRSGETGNHHGAHCLCPCHGLTVAPRAPAALPLALVAFVRASLPAGLSLVDLPSPLRPPIAA